MVMRSESARSFVGTITEIVGSSAGGDPDELTVTKPTVAERLASWKVTR
jgi:hypothetical protein